MGRLRDLHSLVLLVSFTYSAASVRGAPSLVSGQQKDEAEENLSVQNFMQEEEELAKDRFLMTSVTCPGGGPVNYFNLDISFTPQGGFDVSGCGSSEEQLLGKAVNDLLEDYGLGSHGVGDDAVYAAEVCTTPITRRRRLTFDYGGEYRGSGQCRHCDGDNQDQRRKLNDGHDPNWFKNIYKPEMQNTLRNAITSDLAPNHVVCLGNGPRVDVYVTEVAQSQLNSGC